MTTVTQEHIASALGVSRSAVKAVFNPDSRIRLGSETRQRILTTALQMGYVPNHAGRRLARSRSAVRSTSFDQVGLIYLAANALATDVVCLEMMSGAEHELSKVHASVTFIRVSEPADWKKVERLTRAGGLDGWLVYGSPNDEIAMRLRSTDLPFVILGDHQCAQPIPFVNMDNFAVGHLAVKHLAALGHRRIAFLGSNLRYVYEREMLAGFRAAVKELKLDVDERLIGNLSSWTGDASKRLIEWLRNADPMPSAVFAAEYDWAAWIHLSLREAQIEVPTEISVLALEGVSPATQRENFTRIELPMAEVGRRGALLLHRIILEPGMKGIEARVSPSLIEGWSTAPPRSKGEPTNQGKVV